MLKDIRRLLIIIFALIYITNYFFPIPLLFHIYFLLLLFVVLQAMPQLPKTNLRVCLSLFAIGSIILLINQASLSQWTQAFTKNAGLVTLFVAIPLIRLPFFYEDYQNALKQLAQKHMSNVWSFCLLTSVSVHLLGAVISLGSIPLVYELFKENARLYKADKLFLAAILQGYMTTCFWSPALASMAVITETLHIPWLQIVPIGLMLTVVSLSITLFWIYLEIRLHPARFQALTSDPETQVNWPHIITVVVLLITLIGAIVLFDLFTDWQLLIIIPIVSLLFPITSALIQGKVSLFKNGMNNYYKLSLFKINNEVVLFTAAGFLGKSLEISGFGKYIPQIIPPWLNNYPFISILFLMILMVIIALLGIHPVVTASALVGSVNPMVLGFPPFIFAITILCGWAISILISPFSGMSLVTSGLVGLPPWDISIKINGPLGLVILFVLAGVITLLIPLY